MIPQYCDNDLKSSGKEEKNKRPKAKKLLAGISAVTTLCSTVTARAEVGRTEDSSKPEDSSEPDSSTKPDSVEDSVPNTGKGAVAVLMTASLAVLAAVLAVSKKRK